MNKSTRRIATLAIAAAVVLSLVWYIALWSPQGSKLRSAHKARAAAEQQIVQLDSQVVQLHSLVKQIPADTARLNTLDAALPDNPSLDTALKDLHQVASATGVSLTAVAPTTPTVASGSSGLAPAPGGPAITLTMTASGSYAQMMSFLRSLASMPRALVVDHLQLSGTSALVANISARIFYDGGPTP